MKPIVLCYSIVAIALTLGCVMVVANEETPEPNGQTEWSWVWKSERLGTATMGGRFFWNDVLNFRSWRIQSNVYSGHFRLLDPQDYRHTSGSLDECLEKLESIKKQRGLKPLSGRVVIFVHGMGRSGKTWTQMAKAVEEQGDIAVAFDYASTQCAIDVSALHLRRVISSLEGVETIDFVCHSMGGLVIRSAIGDKPDPRFHRLVMLAVPNRGAEMADLVGRLPVYGWICGPGGCQLGTSSEGLIPKLPTPPFEFAVIAAGKGTPTGYNPLIPGDDDGTITVTSTRLPGASDFLQVNGVLHSYLMYDTRVIEATNRFLRTGALRESGIPQPIENTEPQSTHSAVEVE